MKSLKTLSVVLVVFAFHFGQVKAQEIESLDEGSVESQFQYLEKKSGNYRANGVRYEVVRIIDLNKLRQNIADSLDQTNKTLTQLRATIAENETEINVLGKKLEETSNNLKTLTEEKDSMSFFGAMVSKGTYQLILGFIVFTLLLLLLLFIYRFRNSNFLTQQAKTALADLEQEYEQHRRRALEREQKISRQLQDELNKNKKTI
ncbi:MAG: tRNA (guanine-N1)-methyltransferase [Bacteroidota bacterium]